MKDQKISQTLYLLIFFLMMFRPIDGYGSIHHAADGIIVEGDLALNLNEVASYLQCHSQVSITIRESNLRNLSLFFAFLKSRKFSGNLNRINFEGVTIDAEVAKIIVDFLYVQNSVTRLLLNNSYVTQQANFILMNGLINNYVLEEVAINSGLDEAIREPYWQSIAFRNLLLNTLLTLLQADEQVLLKEEVFINNTSFVDEHVNSIIADLRDMQKKIVEMLTQYKRDERLLLNAHSSSTPTLAHLTINLRSNSTLPNTNTSDAGSADIVNLPNQIDTEAVTAQEDHIARHNVTIRDSFAQSSNPDQSTNSSGSYVASVIPDEVARNQEATEKKSQKKKPGCCIMM